MRTALAAVALGAILVSSSPLSVQSSSSLIISNKVVAPDGFNRSAVVVNGIFPAPLVKGIKGDKFRLNVVNKLTDPTMLRSTSIHWHGILQKTTNWADGAVGVNQCPISPSHAFLYQFSVDNQAGTFWYHSHFGTQYCDGLRGPFVVYDPFDPYLFLYDVDDESTVITLADWYHKPAPVIQQSIPVANTTLINGKGRFSGGPPVDLAVVNVQPGKRYRLRLVSISCDPNFIFSIDSHQLTIIEVDGQYVKPHTVDSIQIFAGQRYSVILNACNRVDNYWIRALPNSGSGDLPSGFAGGLNSAILRYKGAPKQDPTSTQTNGTALSESDLMSLSNAPIPGGAFPGGADLTFNLTLGFDPASIKFLINNKSFVPPDVPVLLQILSGVQKAQDLLPQGSVYTLPRNKAIEINIPGGLISGPHPFHLHGHSFAVVKSAGSEPNFQNPVRRDVVATSKGNDTVTIRFTTDNPGPWLLHCHIDWHLQTGLAIVFAEDPEDTPAFVSPVPDAWKQLCPIYDSLPPSETSVELQATAPS